MASVLGTIPMRFTIRDLFLVTVIVAVVLGWWVDHRVWPCQKHT